MKSAKKAIAIVLSVLMLALCAVPAFAEGEYEYTPETCPGHLFAEPVTVLPTCMENGYTVHTCTKCGYTYNNNYVSPTSEHDWQVEVVQTVNCGTQGITKKTCRVCQIVSYTNEPASGEHNWEIDSDRAPHPATCARSGEEYYKCRVCGNQKAVEIPATGAHVDANGDGQCDNCGISTKKPDAAGATSIWAIFDRIGKFFNEIWNRIVGFFNR